jgi:hypothetical protein
MIINEKQIMALMNMALEYYSYLSLIGARKDRQPEILDFIGEIQGQQSEDLKVIE